MFLFVQDIPNKENFQRPGGARGADFLGDAFPKLEVKAS
jgi:hypothetical protein